MAHKLPTGLRTHAQRVCSLYKKVCRNMESFYTDFLEYRYEAVLMRQEFDKNKDIKDLRVAKKLLLEGEQQYIKLRHPSPMYFVDSVGGCAHERYTDPPDWVVDYWHHTEKAMYPKYFATREKRKKEYIEFYNKQYPNAQKHFEEDH